MNLGMLKYIGIGLAALALIAVIVTGVRSCKKIDQSNHNTLIQAGADNVTAQQEGETINAVLNAQQAVQHPTDQQLNVVCSKYDRNCTPHHP